MPVEVTPFCWEHTLNTVKNLPSIKVGDRKYPEAHVRVTRPNFPAAAV